MNKIVLGKNKNKTEYSVSQLVGSGFTAFIGSLYEQEESKLFLITYSAIVMAEEPRKTWSEENCTFFVERFVDLNISIIEIENLQ